MALRRWSVALLAAAMAFWPAAMPAAFAADDGSRPTARVKLVFLHHSVGQNWLDDDQGRLGAVLNANNYFVSDTNYGWGPDSIGDRTDIPNWWEWFRGPNSARYLAAVYAQSGQNSPYTRTLSDPGGPNQIVMFKSCFPNSSLAGGPNDNAAVGNQLTVANAKYVYNELLRYFATRPDKLFVVVTAPPNSETQYAANARAFNNWLVYRWRSENHYPYRNVAVYDFYNVLTGPNNHHRLVGGVEQHVSVPGMNSAYYVSGGDDHPTPAGSVKARNEFVPLLNAFYHRWRTPTRSPTIATMRLPAIPAQDGWVSESARSSGAGVSVNATGQTLTVGDNSTNRAYRTVMSFDTSKIPANAWVMSATVKVKGAAVTGRNPFLTHRSLVTDIRKPYFGSSSALAPQDFQAVPSRSAVGAVSPTATAGWYSAALPNTANQWLNFGGTTQFRLRFLNSTDGDGIADTVSFYSGNAVTPANRPVLEVRYLVP